MWKKILTVAVVVIPVIIEVLEGNDKKKGKKKK